MEKVANERAKAFFTRNLKLKSKFEKKKFQPLKFF